jgi:hypothetical protein
MYICISQRDKYKYDFTLEPYYTMELKEGESILDCNMWLLA